MNHHKRVFPKRTKTKKNLLDLLSSLSFTKCVRREKENPAKKVKLRRKKFILKMSNAWLSEKEKREMLAFALSDETSENDASILQESLMRHLHLTSKNIMDDEDVEEIRPVVEEEKYVLFLSHSQKNNSALLSRLFRRSPVRSKISISKIRSPMVTEKKQTKRSNKKLSITLEEARENFHQDVSSLWREETKKFEDERSGEKDFDEPVTVEPVDQKDWSTATRHQNHSPKKKKESLIVIPKKNDEKKEKTMSPLEVLRSLAKETPLLDLNSDSTSSTAYTFFDISRRNRYKERLVDYVGKKVRNDRYHRERNEMLFNESSNSSSIPRRVALSNEGNHHESARTRLVRMDHTLGHAVPHVTVEYDDERPREEMTSTTVPPGNIVGKKKKKTTKVVVEEAAPSRILEEEEESSPPGRVVGGERVSVTAGPPGQISRMSVTTAAYMNNAKGGIRNNTVTKSPASLRASMFTLSSETPPSPADIPSSPPGSISKSPEPTTTTTTKIVKDSHVEIPDTSPLMMMDLLTPSIAAPTSYDDDSITMGTSHRLQKTNEIDVALADDEMAMPPGQVRQMSVATKEYMDGGSKDKDVRGSVIKPPSSVRESMFSPGLTSPEDLENVTDDLENATEDLENSDAAPPGNL